MRFNRDSSRRTRGRYNRKMKIARRKDEEIVMVVEEMKKTKVKILRGNEW